MAELRAANHGRLSDEALTDLGWSADQAKQVIAALKTERARQPDKPGQTRGCVSRTAPRSTRLGERRGPAEEARALYSPVTSSD